MYVTYSGVLQLNFEAYTGFQSIKLKYVQTFSYLMTMYCVILNPTCWNIHDGGAVILNKLLQYGYQMKGLAENN